MAKPRRTIIDDIRDRGQVQPTAAPRSEFFVSSEPRIRFADTDFDRIGAQLGQSVGEIHKQREEAALAEDAEYMQAGIDAYQTEATEGSANLQAKLATAVSKGQLREEDNPYWIIGYRKAAGRAFVSAWAAQAEVAVQEAASRSGEIDPETSVPFATQAPDAIANGLFADMSKKGAAVNPAIFADPYFTREVARRRAEMTPRLQQIAAQGAAAARKLAVRETLTAEARGLFSALTSSDPATLQAGRAAIEAFANDKVRLGGVAAPHKFLADAVDAHATALSTSGPNGPEEAQLFLAEARTLKLGTVALGQGTEGGRLSDVAQKLWMREQQEEDRRERREKRADEKALTDFLDAPNGPFAAILAAPDATAAQRVIDDFATANRAGKSGLSPRQYRSALELMLNQQRNIDGVTDTKSSETLYAAVGKLYNGDVTGAEEALRHVNAKDRVALQEQLKVFRDAIVPAFHGNPAINVVLGDLEHATANFTAGTTEATNTRLADNERRKAAFITDSVASLATVAPADRQAAIHKLALQGETLLADIRRGNAEATAAHEAVIAPVLDEIAKGKDAAVAIAALGPKGSKALGETQMRDLLAKNAAKQREVDDVVLNAPNIIADRRQWELQINDPAGIVLDGEGKPTGAFIDAGYLVVKPVYKPHPQYPGEFVTSYDVSTSGEGVKAIDKLSQGVQEELMDLAVTPEGLAARAEGMPEFYMFLEVHRRRLVAEAMIDLRDEAGNRKTSPATDNGAPAPQAAPKSPAKVGAMADKAEATAPEFHAPVKAAKVAGAYPPGLQVGLLATNPALKWDALAKVPGATRFFLAAEATPTPEQAQRHVHSLRAGNDPNGPALFPWSEPLDYIYRVMGETHVHVKTLEALSLVQRGDSDAKQVIAEARKRNDRFLTMLVARPPKAPAPDVAAEDALLRGPEFTKAAKRRAEARAESESRDVTGIEQTLSADGVYHTKVQGKVWTETAARTFTPPEVETAIAASRTWLGISYQEVLARAYYLGGSDPDVTDRTVPMTRPELINWQVTPLFKSRGELLEVLTDQATTRQLFSTLKVLPNPNQIPTDDDVMVFMAFQMAAIKRITP